MVSGLTSFFTNSESETFPIRLRYNKIFTAVLQNETTTEYKNLSHIASSHVEDIFELDVQAARTLIWAFSEGSVLADAEIPLSTLRVFSINEAISKVDIYNASNSNDLTEVSASK